MSQLFYHSLMTKLLILPFYHAAMNAERSSQEKAVCPSVRLSNAWIWQDGRKICPNFYTIQNITA